jgi:hypothetical protein
VRRRELGRLPRRNKSEQQSDEHGGHCTKGDHTHIKSERHSARQQALRNHGWRQIQNRGAGQQSERPTYHRKQQTFSEELTNDTRPVGAQR